MLEQVFDRPLSQAANFLEDFLERLGVSTRFETYGVTEADAKRMVAHAQSGVRGMNFIGR